MKKILILGDSCSMPRSFPKSQEVFYEETYVSLLNEQFKDCKIAAINSGGATSVELISQALAYYASWQPDIIIVQAGMADCRPEPIPNLLRLFIDEISVLSRIKIFFYSPNVMSKILKFIKFDRISFGKFQRNIKKLSSIFSKSKIIWCEIYTTSTGEYEKSRPGVMINIEKYNNAIAKNLKTELIPLTARLNEIGGINLDHLHLNKMGHQEVCNILSKKINTIFNEKNK